MYDKKHGFESITTMYDKKFYEKYEQYLKEPAVRKFHDKMFYVSNRSQSNYPNVVDLGSGTGEYYRYYYQHTVGSYFPIDFNNPNDLPHFIEGDYLTLKLPEKSTAFVSLFSAECCMPCPEKYYFYEELFRENPQIKSGTVAGFYYKSKKNDPVVKEICGESYQTIEDQRHWMSGLFTEMRIYASVPSNLFGDDVVEVWKFFERIS